MIEVNKSPDLALLLSHAQRRVNSRLNARLADAGSSQEEYRVLAFLAAAAGQPMTEIADAAALPPPSATKLVDRMVSANLVYRRGDPADRRRVLVALTARGKAAHRRLQEIVNQERTELLTLTGTHDLEELRRLLSRLLHQLGIPQPEPGPASTTTGASAAPMPPPLSRSEHRAG